MDTQKVIARSLVCLLVSLGLTLSAAPVAAQVFDSGPSNPSLFDNVVNVPPDPNIFADSSIGGDGLTTQLNIFDSGYAGNFFHVLSGGEVNISGGSVHSFFVAHAGSEVNISGGSIGENFLANTGSEVNISGGSVGEKFRTFRGSEVNISGGSVGILSTAGSGSEVNISGGSVGEGFRANPGSEVNVSGGSVGDGFVAFTGSDVNISGGSVGDFFRASSGSNINLFGSNFFLDGVLLDNHLTIDNKLTIDNRDVVLSGLLADGSAFSFDLNSDFDFGQDNFSSDAMLTVTLVSIPEPASLALLGLGSLILLGRRRKTRR